MYERIVHAFLISSTVVVLSACDDIIDSNPLRGEAAIEATARLYGQLLDTDRQPVSGSEVMITVGSVPITDPVLTDADGNYMLEIPVERVHRAWAAGQEVTLLFHSPRDDRKPYGTAEGDLVHLLPATLVEVIGAEALVAGNELSAKTAFVPRQGKGFVVDDELIANGGELVWEVDGSQYGEQFRVTLIIEPGSIHKGEDPQEEITLTLIEQALAPMAIPEGGFGPLWTIQPRDVEFDPPARIRIEGPRFPVLGASDLAVGERIELFGASLETGWKLFGDIELVSELDGRVILETLGGIVSHGAWGHVFNNTDNDYGMLVECFDETGQDRVQCAVINDSTYQYQEMGGDWVVINLCEESGYVPPDGANGEYGAAFLTCDQWDYGTDTHDGNRMVYGSDAETRCRTCGGSIAPYVLAMTAGDELGGSAAPVRGAVRAVALCPEEQSIVDSDALWSSISERLFVNSSYGTVSPWNDDALIGEIEAELGWRNFSKSVQLYLPPAVNCPP